MKYFLLCLLIQPLWCFDRLGSSSECGDDTWIPFQDKKCFKFIDRLVNREDANAICAEEDSSNDASYPPSLIIKSQDEQEFVTNFIFNHSKVVDNVWLGARRRSGSIFHWDDGTDVAYSNWVDGNPSNNSEKQCVELTSRLSKSSNLMANDGQWTDVSCARRNVVVCQKLQTWSIIQLQKLILELRVQLVNAEEIIIETQADLEATKTDLKVQLAYAEVEIIKTKADLEATKTDFRVQLANAEEEIIETKAELEATKTELQSMDSALQATKSSLESTITNLQTTDATVQSVNSTLQTKVSHLESSTESLERNPVPIGYIYTQLYDQPSPSTLWPNLQWTEVSSTYAGLFFRAVGGNSASFGSTQGENAPRVFKVETKQDVWNDIYLATDLPVGGKSNGWLFTGSDAGPKWAAMKFETSGGEVRPRNQAVRLWIRTA